MQIKSLNILKLFISFKVLGFLQYNLLLLRRKQHIVAVGLACCHYYCSLHEQRKLGFVDFAVVLAVVVVVFLLIEMLALAVAALIEMLALAVAALIELLALAVEVESNSKRNCLISICNRNCLHGVSG
jgi:hypothetical protein